MAVCCLFPKTNLKFILLHKNFKSFAICGTFRTFTQVFLGQKSLKREITAQNGKTTDFGKGLRYSSTSEAILKKTCLYNFHVQKEGKMVPFAGYSMPVLYGSFGIAASHVHTREKLSIFDVSHMLQMKVKGRNCVQFMESLVVGDLQSLKDNQGTLTVYTNEKGGILDDLIVTKVSNEYLYVVSNAACADKDLAHVKNALNIYREKNGDCVEIEVIDDHALIAVQGPKMNDVLQPLVKCDLSKLYFMNTTITTLCGVENCRVTRCGYTGEDGVELSIPSDKAQHVVETFLSSKNADVKLAGLGARDTLRLEAGLCLYGNDIDENTTPIEAGLAWTIGKRRRTEGRFLGSDIILAQLKNKPTKRRVGFVSSGPPARAHTPILDSNGTKIGEVSSGGPSPSLKKNVAMGYVDSKYAKNGTKVVFDIRKKHVEAEVTKMPFVPAKYYIEK